MSKKLLIITADDFGYSPQRNKGIVECFKAGGITRATLLVNGVAAEEATQLSFTYDIPIGLHLNLTEGKPISDPKKLPNLLSVEHTFYEKCQLYEYIQANKITADEITLEITSQIEKFKLLTNGMLPKFVDGHQHVHVFPVVRDALCKVLQAFQIQEIRLPCEDILNCEWKDHINYLSYLSLVASHSNDAREVFEKYDLRFANNFIGLKTMGQNMREDRIENLLSEVYKENVPSTISCEFMVHPGYPCLDASLGGCGLGSDDFSLSADRLHELRSLISARLKKFYINKGIELVPSCLENS